MQHRSLRTVGSLSFDRLTAQPTGPIRTASLLGNRDGHTTITQDCSEGFCAIRERIATIQRSSTCAMQDNGTKRQSAGPKNRE